MVWTAAGNDAVELAEDFAFPDADGESFVDDLKAACAAAGVEPHPHMLAHPLTGAPVTAEVHVRNMQCDRNSLACLLEVLKAHPAVAALRFHNAALSQASVELLAARLPETTVGTLAVDFNDAAAVPDKSAYAALAGKASKLRVLSLRGCGLDEGAGLALAANLEVNVGLRALNLFQNFGLGDTFAGAAASALRFNAGLQSLCLGSAGFGAEGVLAMLRLVTRSEVTEAEAQRYADAEERVASFNAAAGGGKKGKKGADGPVEPLPPMKPLEAAEDGSDAKFMYGHASLARLSLVGNACAPAVAGQARALLLGPAAEKAGVKASLRLLDLRGCGFAPSPDVDALLEGLPGVMFFDEAA